VLVGHSIAGEELSSIGTRYPEKVSGLIYLEAGYQDAFYEPKGNPFWADVNIVRHDLALLQRTGQPKLRELIRELLATTASLQKGLLWYQELTDDQPDASPRRDAPQLLVDDAISMYGRKYTGVKPPILAIYAIAKTCKQNCTNTQKALADATLNQAKAVQAGYPNARVIRLKNASHAVFRSNESDVEREMKAWLDQLPDAG
jgi:pimeloyl-ACP methyl ester carboxylesterase